MKRRKLTPIILLLISSLVIFYFLWTSPVDSTFQVLPFQNDQFIPDDMKIVGFDDQNNDKWTLGEIRRFPLNQKYLNLSLSELPKLNYREFDASKESIGQENRTNPTARLIIYNRVPKTGSSTIENLLALQGDHVNYTFIASDYYWNRANSVKGEEKMINYWKSIGEDAVYDQHVYFIDTKR